MSGDRPEVSSEDVLAALGGSPYPFSLRELAQKLALHGSQRKELKKALRRLQQERRVVEVGGSRYLLAERYKPKSETRAPEAHPPRAEKSKIGTSTEVAHRGQLAAGIGKRESGIGQAGTRIEKREPGTGQAPGAGRRSSATVHGPPPGGSGPQGGSRVPLRLRSGQASHAQTGGRMAEITGRLVCHRDGYGFVIPEEPIPGVEGDIFIPPPGLADAMHGDRVAVRASPRRRGDKMEGRIVRVLERAHATLVGQFHFGPTAGQTPVGLHARMGARTGAYVQPYDTRLTKAVVIPPGAEVPAGYRGRREELEGALVNIELTRFPTAAGELARGRVVEVLGHVGDLGLDVRVIVRKYHLPDEFPAEVQREGERAPQTVAPAEAARREDFRQLPIVTIDGEDAKDFDDAVYVERLPNGHWLLQVHIADVSHYVRPGSALDREARLRGNSVYFPDRALPMLPVELSNGICSLNPKVDRLALSCLMEIDAQGRTVRYRLAEGVIRSAARMTYTAVNAVLAGDAALREKYGPLADEFEKMRELAQVLNAARERRGSIDFDLPEPVLRFGPQGEIAGITRSERNIAHRLIEEFMLAANDTVARHLASRSAGSLYRVHEPPEPRRVLDFEQIAESFGYTLGLASARLHRVRLDERAGRQRGRGRARVVEVPERIDVTPRHYQRLTEKIAGKPEERIVSYLMLRSLKQARYAEENVGHFALASDCYTHFTSPIRRYPDLIIHRLVRWCLRSKGAGAQEARRQGSRESLSVSSASLAPSGVEGSASSASSVSSVPQWLTHATRPARQIIGPLKAEELRAIAIESSEAERRADDAERELIDLKKLDFMEQHLGDEFEALVISITKFGFWVELFDLFVEGFVPLDSFAVPYSFHEAPPRLLPRLRPVRGSRSLVPAFQLGDRVRVRVDRIDRVLNKIQFAYLAHVSSARS